MGEHISSVGERVGSMGERVGSMGEHVGSPLQTNCNFNASGFGR